MMINIFYRVHAMNQELQVEHPVITPPKEGDILSFI